MPNAAPRRATALIIHLTPLEVLFFAVCHLDVDESCRKCSQQNSQTIDIPHPFLNTTRARNVIATHLGINCSSLPRCCTLNRWRCPSSFTQTKQTTQARNKRVYEENREKRRGIEHGLSPAKTQTKLGEPCPFVSHTDRRAVGI